MTSKLHINNAEPISVMLNKGGDKKSISDLSDSYKFAFNDRGFLTRPETLGIRFQLELLKPELILHDHSIEHTVVVFGSARCISEAEAKEKLAAAKTEEEKEDAQNYILSSGNYESARKLGNIVAEHNLKQGINENKLRICTGGGPGVMEAANRGAWERGDLSIGLNISLPNEQIPNPYITPELSFRFHYFAIRKMHFMLRARAIVVYPGGFGSFDELFEVLTLIQTKKIDPLPLVLVKRKFWEEVIRFDKLIEHGLISEVDYKIIHFVETSEEAWGVISKWYQLESVN
jgi:uncharacterized protein (TIGR00730 family)